MKKYLKFASRVCILLFLVVFYSCSNNINTPEKLFSAIDERFSDRWYKQLKYSRTAIYYEDGDIVQSEKWISEYKYPGQLLIKINREDSPNGYLYRNDSVYIFQNNEINDARFHPKDILIVCLDFFNTPAKELSSLVTNLGFNINKFHTKKHKDKNYFIIGADEDCIDQNQMWFNCETLLIEKIIKKVDDKIIKAEYDGFINVKGMGWISQNITIKVNDEMYFSGPSYNIYIPDEVKDEFTVNDFIDCNFSNDNFFLVDADNKYYYKCLDEVSKLFKFE